MLVSRLHVVTHNGRAEKIPSQNTPLKSKELGGWEIGERRGVSNPYIPTKPQPYP